MVNHECAEMFGTEACQVPSREIAKYVSIAAVAVAAVVLASVVADSSLSLGTTIVDDYQFLF